ncbi:hypothetical protein AAFN85_16270 [Mucilaginibacter sp. CAU 1740]|uniref:hypothetical protein n=1 Tax=Mucilaginibacter sp. CAU 1740 TaxID=3140365 RepID=UPI00325C2C60
MKVLSITFTPPANHIIATLQDQCRILLLHILKDKITIVHQLKQVVAMETAELYTQHPEARFEHITFEVSSNLTYETFTILRDGKEIVTLKARKSAFEYAFRDYDKGLHC